MRRLKGDSLDKYREVERSIRVSIIVPVYNAEKYLDRFLNSVISQSFKAEDYEVILVDDGSTDYSMHIISSYAGDNENFIVIHKSNGGAASARNEGLSIAQGEYVAFLDPDDYIEPDYLEKSYTEAKKSGADIVIFDSWRECVTIKNRATNRKVQKHAEKAFVTKDREDIDSMLRQILYPYMSAHAGNVNFTRNIPLSAPWDKLYKTSFLKKYDIKFPEELKVLDDMCFNLEAFNKAGKISYLPVCLYHYVIIDDSITNSYRPDRAEQDMKAFDYAYKAVFGSAYANRLKLPEEYEKGQDLEEQANLQEQTNLQAYYARVIKSFAICCRLQFFNRQNPKDKSQKLAAVRTYMDMAPYSDAFSGINLKSLEPKLIPVAICGRVKSPKLLSLLDFFENKLLKH